VTTARHRASTYASFYLNFLIILLSLGLSSCSHYGSPQAFAPLRLILDVGSYHIHNAISLGLQVTVQGPNLS
jgi:hypothetical protein